MARFCGRGATPTALLLLGAAVAAEGASLWRTGGLQKAIEADDVNLRGGAAAPQRSGAAAASSFVRAIEFQHRLRVCNAYPYAAALDVYRGRSESLTSGGPMPYKACKDFVSPLKSGDKLEFKIGDASAGTFSVADLPNNDAVLLLIIHRHDTLSTAVSFESHVFANAKNPQVAVIDTYKGAARSSPRIKDAREDGHKDAKGVASLAAARSEDLRFDSVVAVAPGFYDVELADGNGTQTATGKLVAVDHESYVVMRTGVEAQQGPSYPQELVIYPNSDPATLHSKASRSAVAAWLALAASAAAAAAAFSG